MSATLSARVVGISVFAPGLTGWPAALPVLQGRRPLEPAATEIPKLAVLPPAERRRVGNVVRLAIATGLAACEAAGADPGRLPTVFASSGGDGTNCHAICETLASDDRLISPIRFHNSVNNAASGYWGIATGAMAPSAIVSAYDGSFAAGLLEALVQLSTPGETHGTILLLAYDLPYPQPLDRVRPIADACGIGLVLSAGPGEAPFGRLEASLGCEAETQLADAALETLRVGNPAARGLALLQALALGGQARVVLPCHDTLALALAVDRP